LQRIRRLLGITERANGYRPEPVPMPLEQLAKRIRISVSVTTQQLRVRRTAVAGVCLHRRTLVDRLTWLGQGIAIRRLLVRFRRFLPPPW
jgi:hypothetical protein